MLWDEPALWYTEGYHWITTPDRHLDLIRSLLREYPDSPMSDGQYLEVNGTRYGPGLSPLQTTPTESK